MSHKNWASKNHQRKLERKKALETLTTKNPTTQQVAEQQYWAAQVLEKPWLGRRVLALVEEQEE